MAVANAEKWQKLCGIMATLRGAQGCPWDKAQDHESLKRYFLEEVYEALDAIDRQDAAALCDELGDVLLQVVFHAQLAAEAGSFTIDDVVDAVCDKMTRRHPHIFGSAQAGTSDQVLTSWEAIKATERKSSGEKRGLMDLNDNLPALMLAQKVQDKAHRVGFDWPDIAEPAAKLKAEATALSVAASKEEAEAALGAVLFSAVDLARFYDLDAEQALRHRARKFAARFNQVEQQVLLSEKAWGEVSAAELQAYWQQVKKAEEEA